MPLSRLKGSLHVQATRIFTNRESVIASFGTALDALVHDHQSFRVMSFYGVGGIGKSRLLRHLRDQLTRTPVQRVAFIDLEAPHYTSQIDFLLDVRRQLEIEAFVFDYALARFFTVNGRSLSEIDKKWIPEGSVLYDLQEVASDLAEVVAPARLVRRLWSRLSDLHQRNLQCNAGLIAEIDEADDSQLAERFPLYLGESIRRYVEEKGVPLCLVFDSTECLRSRSFYRLTKEDSDSWLRELAACTEVGLWLVAGRERLRWADEVPDWEPVLEQHVLGALEDADAAYFLERVPVTEPGVRAQIIRSARGVPLFLDLCASTYIARKLSGQAISERDFALHGHEIVDRFLAHLESDEKEGVRALAYASEFDADLFARIMKELHIALPTSLFDAFCGSSYVEPAPSGRGAFRIQRIVREHLREPSPVVELGVMRACLAAARAHLDDGHVAPALTRFRDTAENAAGAAASLPHGLVSEFVTLGLDLVDRGHWLAVNKAVEGQLEALKPCPPARAFGFLEALCLRKMGRIAAASETYAAAAVVPGSFGENESLLTYHAAHARHLLGGYDAALQTYRAIAGAHPMTLAGRLAARQIGDLLLLKGRFREADARLDASTRENVGPLWTAECHRFRGHVRRFNFLLPEALEHYEAALAIAKGEGADVMLGKALVNLAETHAWRSPDQAVALADEAIEVNTDIWAPIETGKALGAKAVALAHRGDYEAAMQAADKSLEVQLRNGYRAGEVFTRLARCVILQRLGERHRLESEARKIGRLTDEIGVYRYLFAFAEVLCGRRALVGSDAFEWLEAGVLDRMPRTP